MPDFHPDRPQKCPPEAAKPASGVVYRGIPEIPLSENHFVSHVELNRPNCNRADCTHWGLSIWLSEEAVHHARRILGFTKKWHIAAGKVDANDGVMMPTPNSRQPDHHTLWKFVDRKLAEKFKIVMGPIK